MHDIAIIGVGPAGATLARLLDRKYSVAVIDKRRADDVFLIPLSPIVISGLSRRTVILS